MQPSQVPVIMPSGGKYGTTQRLAFAGLVISSILMAVGIIAPYWQIGSANISVSVIKNFEMAKYYGGVWWACVEVVGQSQCGLAGSITVEGIILPQNNDETKIWIVRIATSVGFLLIFLCSCVALCRAACCNGGKTICHGIMALLGGVAGAIGAIVFGVTASKGFAMQLDVTDFGWAFIVYTVGVGLASLVSFLLCFSVPENLLVRFTNPNPYSQLNVSMDPVQNTGHPMQSPVGQNTGFGTAPNASFESVHGPGY